MDILPMKSFAKQMNNLTFTDYYYRLMLLARSIHEYENLPEGITERWIEKLMFHEGHAMLYKDPEKGLMFAKCAPIDTLNYCEEPTKLTPVGTDYYGPPLIVNENCVLFRNNDEMIPTSFPIKLFAYRLAEISRTIDINIHAQKTPALITGTEKQKLTLKNVYAQWDGFEPVIFGDKALDADTLKVLATAAPVVFPQLQTQKATLWNECLTFLGINNANTDKRERLISNEVEANDTHIDLSADCMLKCREEDWAKAREIFGINTTVKRRARKEIEEECMQDTQNTSEI